MAIEPPKSFVGRLFMGLFFCRKFWTDAWFFCRCVALFIRW